MINTNVFKALAGDIDAQQAYVKLCMLSIAEKSGEDSKDYLEAEELLKSMQRAAQREYTLYVRSKSSELECGEPFYLGTVMATSLHNAALKLLADKPGFDPIEMTLDGLEITE